jgi:hypothetical protein
MAQRGRCFWYERKARKRGERVSKSRIKCDENEERKGEREGDKTEEGQKEKVNRKATKIREREK